MDFVASLWHFGWERFLSLHNHSTLWLTYDKYMTTLHRRQKVLPLRFYTQFYPKPRCYQNHVLDIAKNNLSFKTLHNLKEKEKYSYFDVITTKQLFLIMIPKTLSESKISICLKPLTATYTFYLQFSWLPDWLHFFKTVHSHEVFLHLFAKIWYFY